MTFGRRVRAVLAIAALDLRDLLRERGTWFLLAMFPVLNVVLIVAVPGVLSQREHEQRTQTTFTVAVDGSPSSVTTLRELLEPARLRVVRSADPEKAVKAKEVHAGVVVPDGAELPRAIGSDGSNGSDGGEVRLRVVALSSRSASRSAVGRVVATIEAYRTQLAVDGVAARGLPPRVARPIVIEPVDLSTTEQGARLTLSNGLPVLMLLPLASAVTMAGQRVSGGKDQRVMEPLLVLPVPRSIVLLGKALSGFAVGVIILPAVALPLLAGRFVPMAEAGRTVSLPLDTLAGVMLVAAVVLVFLVALGACLGAASRTTAEMGALIPFVTIPIMLLAFALNFIPLRTTVWLALAPVLGPTLVARDVVAGRVGADDVVAAVVSSVLCAIVLVVVSARLLERERSVLRPTS